MVHYLRQQTTPVDGISSTEKQRLRTVTLEYLRTVSGEQHFVEGKWIGQVLAHIHLSLTPRSLSSCDIPLSRKICLMEVWQKSKSLSTPLGNKKI